METVAYKCINCVAPLQYNAAKQKFTCEFCRSDFTEAELRQYWGELDEQLNNEAAPEPEQSSDPDDFNANAALYLCQNCGAEIIAERTTTAATFCVYCHSPVVISNRLAGQYKPDMVIPFKISEEEAKQRFYDFCGKKKFLPKDFISEAQLDMMKGVYYPYWMVDSLKDGTMNATAKKVRKWKQDDYEYTETKTYKIRRAGKIDFKSYPCSAFRNEDKDAMKYVNPYDDKDFKQFSMAYLSGFLAEKRDTERRDVQSQVDNELQDYAKKIYGGTIDSSYDSVTVDNIHLNTLKESWKYAMLPVWLMTFKYNVKDYLYAMNGQTGKNYGELPCSKGKLTAFGIVVFLLLSVIILFGEYFLRDSELSTGKILRALSISVLVSLLSVFSIYRSYKSNGKTEPYPYNNKAPLDLKVSEDVLVDTDVRRRKIEKDNR